MRKDKTPVLRSSIATFLVSAACLVTSAAALASPVVNGSFETHLGALPVTLTPDASDCRTWYFLVSQLQNDREFGNPSLQLHPIFGDNRTTLVTDYRWQTRLVPISEAQSAALVAAIRKHISDDLAAGGDDFSGCRGTRSDSLQILLVPMKARFENFVLDSRWKGEASAAHVGASLAIDSFLGEQNQAWSPSVPAQLSFRLDASNPEAEPRVSGILGQGLPVNLGQVRATLEPQLRFRRASISVRETEIESGFWRALEAIRCSLDQEQDESTPSAEKLTLSAIANALLGRATPGIVCDGLPSEDWLEQIQGRKDGPFSYWKSFAPGGPVSLNNKCLTSGCEIMVPLPIGEFARMGLLEKWLTARFSVVSDGGILSLQRKDADLRSWHASWEEKLEDLAAAQELTLEFPGLLPEESHLEALSSPAVACQRAHFNERKQTFAEDFIRDLPIPLGRGICSPRAN